MSFAPTIQGLFVDLTAVRQFQENNFNFRTHTSSTKMPGAENVSSAVAPLASEPNSQTQLSHLLDLPKELRLTILEYLVPEAVRIQRAWSEPHGLIVSCTPPHIGLNEMQALRLVNNTIKNEVEDLMNITIEEGVYYLGFCRRQSDLRWLQNLRVSGVNRLVIH